MPWERLKLHVPAVQLNKSRSEVEYELDREMARSMCPEHEDLDVTTVHRPGNLQNVAQGRLVRVTGSS